MTRILLALLALLGFAVQAAPAEATAKCGVGSAEIGTLTITRSQVRTVVAQVEQFAAPVSRQVNLRVPRIAALPRLDAGLVPAVLVGIDRARQ